MQTLSLIYGCFCSTPRFGGARRDRTDDLKLAKLALSQLSYGPEKALSVCTMRAQQVVGLDRLELSTSRLSGVRSNHLSYRPEGHMRSSKKDQTLPISHMLTSV